MQLHVERADLAALLDIELAAALPACAGGVTWSSPLARDRFDEPRDARFWTAISRPDLGAAFADWRPQSGGPSWDAVGRIDSGAVVLVEAKAHVAEFGGKGMGATNPDSIEKIESALDGCRRALHASGSLADWLGPHYQLANRLAWTMRLRECRPSASCSSARGCRFQLFLQ